MALKLYEENDIQDIADAIRAKTLGTNTMTVSEMADEIESIEPHVTYELNSAGGYTVTIDL